MFNRHLVGLLVEAFVRDGAETTNGQGVRAARLRAIKAEVSAIWAKRMSQSAPWLSVKA